MNVTERVVGLIDMDCFYAQVEQRDQPNLWGKPVIVVQHTRQGVQGGILAVSYEARSFGVKRGMPVVDAKKLCAELSVCHVPIGEHADKADIQKYRDASAEVFEVLNNYDATIIVEKASVDEAFLDLTAYVNNLVESSAYKDGSINEICEELKSSIGTTHVANGRDIKGKDEEDFVYDREENMKDWLSECRRSSTQLKLLIAARTIEDIRRQIQEKTQFFCSAGIANNKTVVPPQFVAEIFKTTPISDVRGFGGKLGRQIQDNLKIKMMGEILEVDRDLLQMRFPNCTDWLLRVALGFDDEPVKLRNESSSIAVSKNFPGRNAIRKTQELKHWVEGLTKELAKRLATDQIQISSYNPDVLLELLWKTIKPMNRAADEQNWQPSVYNISLSVSRFTAGTGNKSKMITEWVRQGKAQEEEMEVVVVENNCQPSSSTAAPVVSEVPEHVIPIIPQATTVEDDDLMIEDDFINVDGELISRKVFNELPDFIKKEYEHRIALAKAREVKKKEVVKEEVGKRGKKRPTVQEKPGNKAKRIDAFFKTAEQRGHVTPANCPIEFDPPEPLPHVLLPPQNKMTKPINWFVTWLPLLKFSQAVCVSLIIILLLEGREQWFFYQVVYIFAFLVLFFAIISLVLHYFDITESNGLPWHTIEMVSNLGCALASIGLAAVLLWDVWNMSSGRMENIKYHSRAPPFNIGLAAWTRRTSIVGGSLVIAAALFIVTYLKLAKTSSRR
ncbi:unnamed protein product [Caenorhabditis auriculariae]|uniref:UmuC domain-containing protein n=1 Tax=Caenorhabditis auriculariae TaxID=2777116 RepID=A0A8S1HNJ8_9PELO|nr:unnamed protein product [Caenorhabditis auriculariae]